MAYQSKKYRKFVATAATATLVATAVAPAAGFAAESNDFKDLSGYGWAEGAINYLVSKGAIEGYEDGSFRPGASLSRAEAATILARTLGLEIKEDAKASFGDAENHWASKYIAAIQEQKPGVINGFPSGDFKPDDKIARQDFAKMIVAAYPELKRDESAVVQLKDKATYAEAQAAVEVLASLGIVTGFEDGTFKPTANVNRAQTATFVHRTEVPAERVPVETTEAKVVSVSAINANEIKVEFNREVNTDSAKLADNYKIVKYTSGTENTLAVNTLASGAADIVVLEDKKSVVIKLTTTLDKADNYKVTVDGVMDSKYDKVLKFESEVQPFFDAEAPKLVKAEYDGTNLVATFNEPIDGTTLAGIVAKVNGVDVTASAAGDTAGDYTVTFTLPSSLTSAGNYTLTLTGATDLLANVAGTQLASYAISTDTTAPAVSSLKQVASNAFKVTFSEGIQGGAVELNNLVSNGKFTVVKGSYAIPSAQVTVTAGDNAREYVVTIADAVSNPNKLYNSGESTANLTVNIEGYKDNVGLVGNKYTGSITLTKDTTGPVVVSEKLNTVSVDTTGGAADGTATIKIPFNEAVTVADSTKVRIYKDGILYTTGIATVTPAGKEVTVTTTAGFVDGPAKLTVEFLAGALEDEFGNKNSAVTTNVNYNVAETFKVITSSILTAPSDNGNVIVLNYGENMDSSAAEAANYKLDGSALPAGTKVSFVDGNQKVQIDLPETYKVPANANYVLTVSKDVKTKNGLSVAADADGKVFTTAVQLVDNVAPELKGAKFIDSNNDGKTDEIELTFSEVIDATATDDFLVQVGSTAIELTNAEIILDATAKTAKVKLTLSSEINVSQATTVAIAELSSVNTAVDTADAAGNTVTVGSKVTVTK